MFRRRSFGDNYGNYSGTAQQRGQYMQGVTNSTNRMSQALRQAQLAQEQRFRQSQAAQEQAQAAQEQAQAAQEQAQAAQEQAAHGQAQAPHGQAQAAHGQIGGQPRAAHGQGQAGGSQQQKYYDPSVQFEPLTEDMLKMLGKAPAATAPRAEAAPKPEFGVPVQNSAASPIAPSAVSAPKPAPQEIPADLFRNPYLTKTDIAAEKIAGLIQDEVNGAAFYRRIAEPLGGGKAKTLLERLVAENDKRIVFLSNMYYDTAGRRYEPTAPSVDFSVDLKVGLKAAVAEENLVIDKILDMLETEQNPKLQQMLHRKLNNVNKILELLV